MAQSDRYRRQSQLLVEQPPPGAWAGATRAFTAVARPVEVFLHTEAASGAVLLLSTLIALGWASSPWGHLYHELVHLPIGLKIGSFDFTHSVHFWINDGLMTLFFFVVGLEIRREIHRGELSELRRAALPAAAAIFGMVVPAMIYGLLTRESAFQSGWGIPMATDIAFAVGVLTLLGKRASPALRIFLLALAIIDDVGAILVIGVAYSEGLAWEGFALVGAGMALIVALQKFGVRPAVVYIVPGLIVWAGCLWAGIHPTLGGVIVGMMTPAKPWRGPAELSKIAARVSEDISHVGPGDVGALQGPLSALHDAQRETLAPVDRLQLELHAPVAFLIMPLFALANAGIPLNEIAIEGDSWLLVAAISLGLVLGKPLGVLVGTWLAVQLGIATLPRGVGWGAIAVAGAVAGIGFTMSLFIAQLAFEPGSDASDASKLAILLASAAAALFGLGLGLRLSAAPNDDAAVNETEAEQSTTA